MAAETPSCRRETLSIDLNDGGQRCAMYEAAGPGLALLITEGLLMYLPAGTVDALAAESWQQSGAAHWITDITTSAFSKTIGGGVDTMQSIRHVRAPDYLNGEQILELVQRRGWTSSARRSYISDVGFVRERTRRMMGGAPMPQFSYPPNDPTGVHLFSRI